VSGGSARTLAVARFLAADVFRSQRYLLPLLVYAAVLGALSGSEVTGALSSIYIRDVRGAGTVFGLVLLLIKWVERATGGWGVGFRSFGLPFLIQERTRAPSGWSTSCRRSHCWRATRW
jgi:hypothetical protein